MTKLPIISVWELRPPCERGARDRVEEGEAGEEDDIHTDSYGIVISFFKNIFLLTAVVYQK